MLDEHQQMLLEFEKSKRGLSVNGIKGQQPEFEYSRLYDKLALNKVGGRRRLKKKYRA